MLATIETEFATLNVTATSDDPVVLSRSLATRLVQACGTLPPGMSVDSTIVLDVSLQASVPIRDFRFTVRVDGMAERGSRESGEHLEAQGWAYDGGAIMLGTEDGESLMHRMSWYTYTTPSEHPISYLADGLELSLSYIRPNADLTFHFAVAHNRADAGDDSLWFAVDIPHDHLGGLPRVGIPKFR